MRMFFSIVFVLAVFGASSQEGELLSFERIRGLSQNTVYSMLRDRQGFFWVATASGLNRYDGVEMKAYKPSFGNAAGQMKGRIIRSALLEDDEEQIWFSTDIAVHSFNKRTRLFTQHKLFFANKKEQEGVEQKADIETFANPLLKKDNYIWFATAGGGLYALNTKNGNCISYPVSMKDDRNGKITLMYNATYDANNRLWFASNKGLLSFDLSKKEWKWLIKGVSLFAITSCNDTLYTGNNDGITWIDPATLSTGVVAINGKPAHIPGGMIRCFYTDEQKNTWAGDQTGNVYLKSSQDSQFSWKGNINGYPPAQTLFPVYSIYADNTGNLWTGADVLGLSKAEINPIPFRKFPAASSAGNGIQDLFIHSIYEDEDENIWLGTFQNGLLKLDPKTGKTTQVQFPYFDPLLPYAKSVPLVKQDDSGNLWTSYSGHLYIKEKGKKNFIPLKIPFPPDYLQSPQLWAMTSYKEGWLLATNIGLYLVSKKQGQYNISHLKEFAGTKITTVWTGPDKQTWVVPETGGIYIASAVEELNNAKRIFTGENIKAVRYDSLGRLIWICTASGLIAYSAESEKFKIYTEANGLPNSYVYGILIKNDDVWVSTNNGLATGKMQFDEGALFPDIRFLTFTESEGLPANEFNTGAYHHGRSGKMYFGTVKGVTWFQPEEVRMQYPLPVMRLIDFRVNDKEADSATAPEFVRNIRLTYRNNNLFFRFRAIDYNNADKIRYAYQLEGWDKSWVYSGSLNEVRYNNLTPGNYVFKIKAANGSGVWGDKEYTVSISIAPPFWKTWWFYSLVVLLLMTVLVLLTRYFAQQKLKQKVMALERQKEIDKERQRISREMHDDIGAGLTQITLMSESAKTKHKAGELDEIAQTSRQLVSNMSEIIWSLNPENKTLDQLLAYLREQLNKQLEYSGIHYSIRLPETGNDILLTNEQRRNILLVTKEIVNNAIKYSKAGNISVNATLQDGSLGFEIQDDGTGFDINGKYTGSGQRNIRQRIEELGGILKIESVPGKGSSFVYHIPLQATT